MMLGLSHKSESVRGKVIEWLKKESKASDSKDWLLQFILEDLYNPEYEHLWLTTSAQLIMSLTSNSAHIRQKVFGKPLSGYVSSGMFTLSTRPDLNKLFTKPMILLSLTSASKAGPKQSANRSFQLMIIQAKGNEHILKARSRYFDKQSNERNSKATDQPIKVQYPSQDKNGSILNDDNHSRSTT